MGAIQILDDSDPAVIYSSGWSKAGGSYEFNGTTTLTSQPGANATVYFTGVQISVVGTLGPQTTGTPAPQSNYSVDGGTPVHYTAPEDQSVHYSTIYYMSPVLQNGQHTLVVTNILISDSFFIDYFLIYKSDSDSTFAAVPFTVTLTNTAGSSGQTLGVGSGADQGQSSKSNNGTIIGSALGAAVVIIVVVAFILWRQNRNKRKADELIISSFRDDRQSPALAHIQGHDTPRSAQPSPFMSTGSHITQPYVTIPTAPEPRNSDSLPSPPGYTSDIYQPSNQVQATSSSGNLGLPSKTVVTLRPGNPGTRTIVT